MPRGSRDRSSTIRTRASRAPRPSSSRGSSQEKDREDAEAALVRIAGDTRSEAAAARRDLAAALGRLAHPGLRPLLIPLLYDPDRSVAEEALRTAKALGPHDFLFVPTLVSLLRNRRLKSAARDVLVSYGESVLDALDHFLRDQEEDVWVRRHLPATIAQFETQRAVDILTSVLAEPDGFLRYKAVAGLERLRRARPDLNFPREPIETLALREGRQFFTYLTLDHNLTRARAGQDSLLAHALKEKIRRTSDRVYRLLALIYPWKDIAAARWALERGDSRARSSASEYLDNILTGNLRKRLVPVLEDMPLEEKVRKAHVQLRSRPRDIEETLLELINDDDQVVSAAAIDLVRELKLWALEDDVEHVLAHRDVKDWYVFEAASWTLAARRVGEARRRDLWLEPLPAVEIASRLRRLPLFASLWVDELFRIAGAGRQTRHDAGRVLLQEGALPEAVHVLLDGTVVARGHDGVAGDRGAGDARLRGGARRAAHGRNGPRLGPGRRAVGAGRRRARAARRQHGPRRGAVPHAGGGRARQRRRCARGHQRGRARRSSGSHQGRTHADREGPRAPVGAGLRARVRRGAAADRRHRARDEARAADATGG